MSAAASARRSAASPGRFGAWPACVALVVAMLAVMAAIVYFAWARRVPAAKDIGPIEPP